MRAPLSPDITEILSDADASEQLMDFLASKEAEPQGQNKSEDDATARAKKMAEEIRNQLFERAQEQLEREQREREQRSGSPWSDVKPGT